MIEIDAPAKINLRLRVLSQLTSGFHSLETVFCAVSLADTVRLWPGGTEIRLIVQDHLDLGPDEDNLAVRAARRFYLELGAAGAGLLIELTKRIPVAAGLGGGSSNAAATLLALNAVHDHPFTPGRLLELGGELGSDVPFFLCGSPLALGWGRGERLLTLPPLPSRPVLIAHPGVAMPTGQAFQRIAELRGGGYEPPASAFPLEDLGDWGSVVGLAENDFQEVAIERVPMLAAARDEMREAGAEIVLLAGSGASLVGLFPTPESLAAAEVSITHLGFRTWPAHTLETLPGPRFTPPFPVDPPGSLG